MPPPPARGPLAAAVVRFDAPPAEGSEGPRLVYADLGLAERADLRRALGIAPTTRGAPPDDEALVLHAYRRWGPALAERLGGQFAFAVWDPDHRQLVAVRDRTGIQPLFWARSASEVVVGGDLRAMLATGRVSDALDDAVMAAVLLDGRVMPATLGETCLRDVREVRAGYRLVASADGVRHEPYWDPEATPRTALTDRREIGEAMRAILRDVIGEAVGEEPEGAVGVHLSSGIDSSLVAALTAEARRAAGHAPPPAFSWHPPPSAEGPRSVEHARIEVVAARWALPLRYAPVDAELQFASRLLDATRDPVTMWANEEPVRRAAHAAGVTVLLSGWGGDEGASFSGRGLVAAHLLRTGRWGPVLASALRDPLDAARRLRRWRANVAVSRGRPPLEVTLQAALRGELQTFATGDLLRRASLPVLPVPPTTPHAYMGWLLRGGHLGARTGSWARAGTAYGLRYRYPLLDRRVVAFALSLPDEAWLTHGRLRRWPVRAAAAGLVPDEVRLGDKAEPLWGNRRRRTVEQTAGWVERLLTPEAAGRRPDHIDGPALRSALDLALSGAGASDGLVGGFQAIGYLGLGEAHGVPPGGLPPGGLPPAPS